MEEKYSYSKLDTYVSCPFKYLLRYVEGHYISVDNIATAFGSLVHDTEEKIANCIKTNTPIDYITLKNNFILKLQEIKYKFPKDYSTLDKSNRTYEDKAYEYLNGGIYRLEGFMRSHPTYEIIGAEIPFDFKFKNILRFTGKIDRVIKDTATNTYIIQDIKTWAEPKDQKDLATPLQFVVYTLAFKEANNLNIEQIKCQYDLPLCDLTQNAGTGGYINRGITKLEKIFDGITAKQFEPKQTPLCYWCEYCHNNPNAPEEAKNLCPYFLHWTKDKKDFSKENEWAGIDNHQTILEAYHKKLAETRN